MSRMSSIFHDEHLPAPQRLVYWMEKIVRHGGMSHLRTAAFELNAIQYNLLDVMAFIGLGAVGIISILLYASIVSCKYLCKCSKGRKKQKDE